METGDILIILIKLIIRWILIQIYSLKFTLHHSCKPNHLFPCCCRRETQWRQSAFWLRQTIKYDLHSHREKVNEMFTGSWRHMTTASWQPPPGDGLLTTASWQPPPGYRLLTTASWQQLFGSLLTMASWQPPSGDGNCLLTTTSMQPPPDNRLQTTTTTHGNCYWWCDSTMLFPCMSCHEGKPHLMMPVNGRAPHYASPDRAPLNEEADCNISNHFSQSLVIQRKCDITSPRTVLSYESTYDTNRCQWQISNIICLFWYWYFCTLKWKVSWQKTF